MEIDLRKVPHDGLNRNDSILFSESQSRFVVTVSPSVEEAFRALFEGTTFAEIGVVSEENRFRVKGLGGQIVIDANVRDLKEAWQKPLRF